MDAVLCLVFLKRCTTRNSQAYSFPVRLVSEQLMGNYTAYPSFTSLELSQRP